MRVFKYILLVLITIFLSSCLYMVDKIPRIKMIIKDESQSKIDSLWLYTDSTISNYPNIITFHSNAQLKGTITDFCFEDKFKFWIRLKDGNEFSSDIVMRNRDLDGYILHVDNTKIKVEKTDRFIILNYAQALLFVFLLVCFFKIFVNLIILRPAKKIKYFFNALLLNVFYLIYLFLILMISSKQLYFTTSFYVKIGLGFIIVLLLDVLLSNKIINDKRKYKLIIASSILSNILFLILGTYLMMLYMLWIF